MNEMPLHEPLIAEEGKEKERVFTGTPERIVNICLASISALIIYWTASPVRPTPSGNIWIASCGWAC